VHELRTYSSAPGELAAIPTARDRVRGRGALAYRIWSYTNACYEPPEPFVAPKPFVPFAIAAVELEHEKMIVLGQVVAGVGVDELEVGMPMELDETLYRDGDTDKLIWKWKPAGSAR
jgi:uncharacterized OB-fold protein